MKFIIIVFLLFATVSSKAQKGKAENVVIITLDGFRWQELFGGADKEILDDKQFSEDSANLYKKFWAEDETERRKKLMPFFWNTIAANGQLHGNRNLNSKVNVMNPYWFSYPGYNEIFTGYPDTAVNSNDKNPNFNTTVLEFLHRQPGFKNKVAAFTSWDCFDAIFNESRAGFLVSSGFDSVKIPDKRFELLNDMQMQSPRPLGDGVRPDHITYFIAKEYISQFKPRLLYIGFDETDDYAHGGKYDQYLEMAHMTDKWIADLWAMLQSMPDYKDKTALIITTDHGRGDKIKKEWTSHGKKIEGADQIWLAALGAGIEKMGEVNKSEQIYQAQLAQTIAELLGYDFKASQPVQKGLLLTMKR
jgi:hypothetical protein